MDVLFLHALPLDGSMWAEQRKHLPGVTHAPTLYSLGDSIQDWASGALRLVTGDRLVVVGCSVGGSCALEVARMAPDRIAALVLIGTKVRHRPDPALHASAIRMLAEDGMDGAWRTFWHPLFSPAIPGHIVARARDIALGQSAQDVARGVTAFHTRPSYDRFLSELSRPVIFVTGMDDSAPGPPTNAVQASLAPAGRLHVIPDCGHYVPLEAAERLNAILGDVLAGVA